MMRACRGLDLDAHVCRTSRPAAWPVGEGPVSLFRSVKANGAIGGPIDGHAITAVVKQAAAAAGFPPEKIGGHSLRAGFVTQAFRSGADAHSIMRQTGHRDPKTLEIYARESAPRSATPSPKSACDPAVTTVVVDKHWALFADWCTATNTSCLPATPETVLAFLDELPTGPATVRRRLLAVDAAHRHAGYFGELAAGSEAVVGGFVLGDGLAEVGEVVADCPPSGGSCGGGDALPAGEGAGRTGARVLGGGDRRDP